MKKLIFLTLILFTAPLYAFNFAVTVGNGSLQPGTTIPYHVSSGTVRDFTTFNLKVQGPQVSTGTVNISTAAGATAAFWIGTSTVGTNITTLLKGTTTNDNARAGDYGEHISSTMASVDVNAANTGTWNDYGTVVLTSGDWDLTSTFVWRANGATVTDVEIGISNATGNSFTDQISAVNNVNRTATFGTGETGYMNISRYRVSIAAGATYYQKTQFTYTGGPPKLRAGYISARRVR